METKMKTNFNIIRVIFILCPILFWGIIATIWYFLGLEIAFKTIFNFLLGLVYAFTSFYCAYCHNSSLEFEKRKDWFLKDFDYMNIEQYKLENERRQLLYNKLSSYNSEYQSANKALYILQGIIALIVSLEFLFGWA